MKKILPWLCAFVILLAACKKNNAGNPVTPPPVVPADTGSLQKNLPFLIGAALNPSLMRNNTNYYNLANKEFNSITAENAMKFGSVHPAENTYTWTDADYLVNFAQTNNKRIHGHTLVWHQSLPAWVNAFTGDSAAWENLLKTHIQTVVTHFKGKVGSWDVVNEAFEDNGNLRNSIWLQHLGSDYIARCFQYARAADPAALLFYNDYGHDYSKPKRTAIFNLLASFKTRGVPIDGNGLQFHTNHKQSDVNLAAAINEAAVGGLKIHLSELDISVNQDNTPGITLTESLKQLQAAKYKYIVQVYKALPVSQQFGITTWNVTDADSWIPGTFNRPDWPLPFDAAYQRKPAYYAIIEGAK